MAVVCWRQMESVRLGIAPNQLPRSKTDEGGAYVAHEIRDPRARKLSRAGVDLGARIFGKSCPLGLGCDHLAPRSIARRYPHGHAAFR